MSAIYYTLYVHIAIKEACGVSSTRSTYNFPQAWPLSGTSPTARQVLTAFEQQMLQMLRGSEVASHLSGQNIEGVHFVCRMCLYVRIYRSCTDEYGSDEVLIGCCGHHFMRVFRLGRIDHKKVDSISESRIEWFQAAN